MIANLTTPLIGIVSTTAIGRLDDAALLGGVAMASVIFDCLFWLFAFLRISTLAFTAQAIGAGDTRELGAILMRSLFAAGLIGGALIMLQLPLAAILFSLMGGSDGAGSILGKAPNLVSMVSTGKDSITTMTEAKTTATSIPGHVGR